MANRYPFVEIGDEHDVLVATDEMIDPVDDLPYLTRRRGSGILPTYATIAAAIADSANLVNGQLVIIQGGDNQAAGFPDNDRGIWRVDTNQGAAYSDYTQLLNAGEHGAEIALADAGSLFPTDNVESALQTLGGKQVFYKRGDTSLEDVNVSGTSTTAFDLAISALVLDNGSFTDADGSGDATTNGVVLNSTHAYQVPIRVHSSRDVIDDGNGNEVYGRLTHNGTDYVLSFYSYVSGTETAYNMPSTNIDLGYILASMDFVKLPAFAGVADAAFFGDQAGISGTIDDANVITNVPAFTGLLTGLGTQEDVNLKVDDLGTTNNGEGASLIGVEDAAGNFTATDVEGVLTELYDLASSKSVVKAYANLAAAAAAAPHDLGTFVLISGDATNEDERGVWEVTANDGSTAPGDYTKRLDVSHTAAEILIADAGSYFTTDNVEAALDGLAGAIGGTDQATRDYSSNVYVTDDDDIVTAIGKLDAAIAAVDVSKVNSLVFNADGAINASTNGPQLVATGTAALDAALANPGTTGTQRIRVLGFATGADYADNDPINQGDGVVFSGLLGGFTGLTSGAVYYADPSTPGAITSTRPSGRGEYAIEVGVAVSTTQLLVRIQEPIVATNSLFHERKIHFRDSSGNANQGIGASGYNIKKGEIWIDDDTTTQNPTKGGTGRYTLYICVVEWTGAGAALTAGDIQTNFTAAGRQN